MASQPPTYHDAMPHPSNCFICKNTWTGKGPICPTCAITQTIQAAAAQWQKAAYQQPLDKAQQDHINDAMQYFFASVDTGPAGLTMPRSRRPSHWAFARPSSGRIYSQQPLLRTCPACKGNYLIESKAGTVCAGCKTVVHNACRNCTSTNTHGLFGDKTQFLECGDCQFIE